MISFGQNRIGNWSISEVWYGKDEDIVEAWFR